MRPWIVFNFKTILQKKKKTETRWKVANRRFKTVQGSHRSKDRETESISKEVRRKERKRCSIEEID